MHGRSLKPFEAVAAKVLGEQADGMFKLFLYLRSGGEQAQVDAAIRGADPELRDPIHAAGVLRCNACLLQWRTAALRLLFASERPFLASGNERVSCLGLYRP